jgi:hypothetical protein
VVEAAAPCPKSQGDGGRRPPLEIRQAEQRIQATGTEERAAAQIEQPSQATTGEPSMNAREAMIQVMADIIGASNDYDNDRLNDPAVWQRFMQEVLNHIDTCPEEEQRRLLEDIDLEQFQQWIDAPPFWDDLNREIERRAQVMLALLPSEHQGNC